MSEKWQGWTTFREADDLKLLYQGPGVYAIRLFDANNGNPIAIGRFLGADEAGILQIGVSENLGRRLSKFYNSCYKGAHSHSEGARLCLIRLITGFEEEVYPEGSLQFNTKWIPNIAQAEQEEERLLKSYFRRFGELPPLNAKMEYKGTNWMEIDTEGDTLW